MTWHLVGQLVSALAMLTMGSTEAVFQLPLIPHHVQQTRRSLLPGTTSEHHHTTQSRDLQQSNVEQQIDALYQGYGTHYIDLWVGTPPQRQTVIVGTGSGKTAFPCSKCTVCGETHHTDSYFVEADSSTYMKTPCGECKMGACSSSWPDANDECRAGYSYAEGSSWSAYESIDLTYAGGPHDKLQKLPEVFNPQDQDDVDPLRAANFAFNLTFGCQDKTTGLFATQLADGILGMDNARMSFWYQAYEHGVIDRKIFSLCLSRQPTASWQGTEAGALTMGGVDERLHTSPTVYSTLVPGSTFHVKLKKIYLRQGGGGNSAMSTDSTLKVVPLNVAERAYKSLGHVVVASGTTDTYFPRAMASAFQDAWLDFTGKPYSHNPVHLTETELNNLPTILFQIEGDKTANGQLQESPDEVAGLAGALDPENPLDVIIAMPPTHYMEFDKSYNKYAARFYMDESWEPVIGANAMMGHDITFDVENNRIGWAESHCDYSQLVEEVEKEEEREEKDKHEEEDSKTEGKGKQPHIAGESAADTGHSLGGVTGTLFGLLLVGGLGLLAWWRRIRGASAGLYQPAAVEVPEWQPQSGAGYEDGLSTNEIA